MSPHELNELIQSAARIAGAAERMATALEAPTPEGPVWPACAVGGCAGERAFASPLCIDHLEEAIRNKRARDSNRPPPPPRRCDVLRAGVLLYVHTSLNRRPVRLPLRGQEAFQFHTFTAAWSRWMREVPVWS